MGMEAERGAIDKHGFRNLLFVLLIYLFGSPFLAPYPSLSILAHTSLSFVLLFSVYAINKHQHRRSVAMVLLLPVMALFWLGIYDIVSFGRVCSYLLLTLYFGLLIYSYTVQLGRTGKVTINVIYATLCLYLIVGLFWGALYAFLYSISPGSYSGALLDNVDDGILYIFNYFSLVTLTTLGYGDITPQTPGAGALCQMEAVFGQFFTAVVVAWLVGNFVSERRRDVE
jgi:voltage-gated potassium channel Kch